MTMQMPSLRRLRNFAIWFALILAALYLMEYMIQDAI
jgi:hypothetical protein